jgi:Leucine-rich repeat (LRR) protein
MPNKSPYKVLRSIKRITKFSEKKASEKKILTVQKLPCICIPPTVKTLAFSKSTMISISPSQRQLSFSKPVLTDIPPEIPRTNLSYLSIPPFVENTRLPPNHRTHGRIPQLDGGLEILQCSTCKKVFEDEDDRKWHYDTKIGRDDCSILRSMLGWNPD